MVGDSWGNNVTLVLVITAAMTRVSNRMITPLPLLVGPNIRCIVGIGGPGS